MQPTPPPSEDIPKGSIDWVPLDPLDHWKYMEIIYICFIDK